MLKPTSDRILMRPTGNTDVIPNDQENNLSQLLSYEVLDVGPKVEEIKKGEVVYACWADEVVIGNETYFMCCEHSIKLKISD